LKNPKRVLIVIDLQNDFLPGGALGVTEGDQVIEVANTLIHSGKFFEIIATQDWHPPNHESFLNIWPVHCVQESFGAEFAANLDVSKFNRVFRKGQDVQIDSYSGFFDNAHQKATGLGDYLKGLEVLSGPLEIHILGLATDYCVKFTALDSRLLGFNTFLIEDGCRAVNLKAGDGAAAIEEMKRAGVRIV